VGGPTLRTVGGIPSIYYGDEQGYVGVKEERLGGDDDIRPVFPSSPSQFSPLGAHLLRAHQDLIGLRRRHSWLVRARTEPLHLENERLIYRSFAPDGSTHLDVEIDLAGSPAAIIRDDSGEELWSHHS